MFAVEPNLHLRHLAKPGTFIHANTIRIRLNLISHLYNFARKEWEMIELQNPVELVRRPRLPQGRDRRLAGTEEERCWPPVPTPTPNW